MFDAFPDGKIDAGSNHFSELQRIAEARLLEIELMPGTGLGAKLRRYISLSKLNAFLSFYGWAICRDGTMIEVKVRESQSIYVPTTSKDHCKGALKNSTSRCSTVSLKLAK